MSTAPPAVEVCPQCGSPHVGDHCKNPQCTWWLCKRCLSYGPHGRRNRWVKGSKA